MTFIQKLQNRLRTYHAGLPATPEALAVLGRLSKYTGPGMKTPHMAVADSGEVWLEFFGPKRRLGIVLDPNPAESSWFLVVLPESASGLLSATPNFDDLVRRFQENRT